MGQSVYRQFSFSGSPLIEYIGCASWSYIRASLGSVSVLGLLLLVALGSTGAWAAEDAANPAAKKFKVLSSGQDALRFSFSDLEPTWTPRTVGDPAVTLYDVSVEGFISSGEPGRVRLPRTGGWVVVPPGTRPEIRPIKEQWLPAGDRPLMVESVPVLIPGSQPWEGSASEIMVLPGAEPPADASIPTAALESLARRGGVSSPGLLYRV